MWSLVTTPQYNAAALSNREPATSPGDATLQDQPLHVVSSALDIGGLRDTAVPAGSRGRIRIHASAPTKFAESNDPTTEIKMVVATWAPDITHVPLPLDKSAITAGVEHLAKSGYSALRIHGLEFWLMAYTTNAFEFPPQRLDAFDWLLAECKRVGIYWILNPRQPELYQAGNGSGRFTGMPASSVPLKARLFTQQEARDHYAQGFRTLYDRVNPYTGTNILQDPALFMVEMMNECTPDFAASASWPAVWMTRDAGTTQGTAGKTWTEWLSDSTQSHGYADIAALNTAWGTAYANFAAVPAPSSNLPGLGMPANKISVDVVKYLWYLYANLASWYGTFLQSVGYSGLKSGYIASPSINTLRESAATAFDDVVNLHDYCMQCNDPTPGLSINNGVGNSPVWEFMHWASQGIVWQSGKPAYWGEYGWPYWGRYRNQQVMLAAYAAQGGIPAVTMFHTGGIWEATYNAAADSRTKALTPYCHHGDPVGRFAHYGSFFALKYVGPSTYNFQMTLNDRYNGVDPVNPGRVGRNFLKMLLPGSLIAAMCKATLNWTSDTTDDTLNNTINANDWYYHLNSLLAAGAITADNETLVSAITNRGNITAVATTGTVAGSTATATSPILEFGAPCTLVTGDVIAITNLTGSVGTWPGTNNRGTRATVSVLDSTHVQITSGLNLTGLSGANFTSGTWCELDNVLQSGNKQIYVSRRRKLAYINEARFKYFATGGASGVYPFSDITGLRIVSISSNAALFVASLDGAAIASSARLLIGLVGDVKNLGETRSGTTNQTLSTVGTYPIQLDDVTAEISIAVARAQEMRLYRLGLDGLREVGETPVGIDASAGAVSMTLRTGQVAPSVFWELIR